MRIRVRLLDMASQCRSHSTCMIVLLVALSALIFAGVDYGRVAAQGARQWEQGGIVCLNSNDLAAWEMERGQDRQAQNIGGADVPAAFETIYNLHIMTSDSSWASLVYVYGYESNYTIDSGARFGDYHYKFYITKSVGAGGSWYGAFLYDFKTSRWNQAFYAAAWDW